MTSVEELERHQQHLHMKDELVSKVQNLSTEFSQSCQNGNKAKSKQKVESSKFVDKPQLQIKMKNSSERNITIKNSDRSALKNDRQQHKQIGNSPKQGGFENSSDCNNDLHSSDSQQNPQIMAFSTRFGRFIKTIKVENCEFGKYINEQGFESLVNHTALLKACKNPGANTTKLSTSPQQFGRIPMYENQRLNNFRDSPPKNLTRAFSKGVSPGKFGLEQFLDTSMKENERFKGKRYQRRRQLSGNYEDNGRKTSESASISESEDDKSEDDFDIADNSGTVDRDLYSEFFDPAIVSMSDQIPSSSSPKKDSFLDGCLQPPEILHKLEADWIYPLTKKSMRFPKAHFFCRLCEYHCDNVIVCNRHVKDRRHRKLKEMKEADLLLENLPSPSQAHTDALNDLLISIKKDQGLTDVEVKARDDIVHRLNVTIQLTLPFCSAYLYGSSKSGFGLKDSDVNIDLFLPDKESPAKILMSTLSILQESSDYSEVTSDFSAKNPAIYFKDQTTQLSCAISTGNTLARYTTQLLQLYCNLDSRVKILGVAFRYWAKLSLIDRQSEGTLPAHAFNLMLIYFLQHHKNPVIPVLHEIPQVQISDDFGITTDISKIKSIWGSKNNQSSGELWIDFFRFYAIKFKISALVISIRQSEKLTRDEKKWSAKKIAIEDPFSTKRNIARSISNQKVFEYVTNQFRSTYKYFGIPQTKFGPLYNKLDLKVLNPLKAKEKFNSEGKCFDDDESVYSKDGGKEIISPKKDNLSRNLFNFFQPDDLISKESDTGEKCDFELVSKFSDSAISGHSIIDPSDVSWLNESSELQQLTTPKSCLRKNVPNMFNLLNDTLEDNRTVKTSTPSKSLSLTSHNHKDSICDSSLLSSLFTSNGPTLKSMDLPESIFLKHPLNGLYDEELVANVRKEDLDFKFDKEIFTDGKGPAIVCNICQKEGHLKQNCPEEMLPKLCDLPLLSNEFRMLLDSVCKQVVYDFQLTESELLRRQAIVEDLQEFIRDIYPDAKLELFGSLYNGFGFQKSDLDICLTFAKKSNENLDCVNIIESLARKLRHHKSLRHVLSITTAKVPIVKFVYKIVTGGSLEGDISLYNTLAQFNTRMLRSYSEIDPRVKPLGYTMKVFAKLCDIGDASRGSLSSYAYILMVIYFLQQKNPPVLPVLQELYDHSKKPPETIIDGWNAWFFDDINKLPKMWPGLYQNKDSVGALWLGLLRFYTEEFNFKDYVISIRQHKPLTRFEKLWNSKCIAIEDPFDLSHNLGAGVSRKMNNYILKALINGRESFGLPIVTLPERYNTYSDYFFDPELLTDAPPPNDRGCRICGKIGHFLKECPRRRERKEKERLKSGEGNKESHKDHDDLSHNKKYEVPEKKSPSDKEYNYEKHKRNRKDSEKSKEQKGDKRQEIGYNKELDTPRRKEFSENSPAREITSGRLTGTQGINEREKKEVETATKLKDTSFRIINCHNGRSGADLHSSHLLNNGQPSNHHVLLSGGPQTTQQVPLKTPANRQDLLSSRTSMCTHLCDKDLLLSPRQPLPSQQNLQKSFTQTPPLPSSAIIQKKSSNHHSNLMPMQPNQGIRISFQDLVAFQQQQKAISPHQSAMLLGHNIQYSKPITIPGTTVKEGSQDAFASPRLAPFQSTGVFPCSTSPQKTITFSPLDSSVLDTKCLRKDHLSNPSDALKASRLDPNHFTQGTLSLEEKQFVQSTSNLGGKSTCEQLKISNENAQKNSSLQFVQQYNNAHFYHNSALGHFFSQQPKDNAQLHVKSNSTSNFGNIRYEGKPYILPQKLFPSNH